MNDRYILYRTYCTLIGLLLISNANAKLTVDEIRNNAENEALDNIKFIQSFTQIANPTFSTIGGGNDCDYQTIQEGINSGTNEVRISYGQPYTENVFITDIDISLRGGFRTCADAEQNNQDNIKTSIIGVENANAPVIAITGSMQRNQVQLELLEISRGSGAGFLTGGGISTLDADVAIMLNKVDIFDNHSPKGGGIAIQGESDDADTDLLLIDTLVYENSSSHQGGGGIFCSGNNSSILITGDSGISSNTAYVFENMLSTGAGGGLLLEACDLTMYSGTKTSSDGVDRRGLSFNTSELVGGAFHANDASQIILNGHKICHSISNKTVCIGNDTQPLNINDNFARYNSGAFGFNSNSETNGKVSLFAGMIKNNITDHPIQGSGTGGAIVVGVRAVLETGRLYKQCWNDEKCNQFKNNKSDNGGAIYGINRADMFVFSTHFEGNRATRGTAIYSNFSEANIESSLFVHNGNYGEGIYQDKNVITSFYDDEFGMTNIIHSTFADNYINDATFDVTGEVSVLSTIIHEPLSRPTITISGVTALFDCVFSSELGSLSLGPNISQVNTFEGDPMFIDRANGNYQLDSNTSTAIDKCHEITEQTKDILYNNRGWDDPNVANNGNDPLFKYDMGAYESYDNDIIFKDGFDI